MLEYNELKPGNYIIHQGEPYEVLEVHVARTQQRKPQNQTKLRSLISNRVIPVTFRSSEKLAEAEIEKRPIKFIYVSKGKFCFSEISDPAKRFFIDEEIIGDKAKFMKGNTEIEILTFSKDEDQEPKIIGVKLPIKVELAVKEAPPSMKGNTASGGGKQVVLETGAVITAPLFIETGDVLRINTETGEYVERVK